MLEYIKGFMEASEFTMEEARELYMVYVGEMEAEITRLIIEYENHEYEVCAKIVHNIKGVSSTYQIMEVFHVAEKLDLLFKRKEVENLWYDINLLEQAAQKTNKEIQVFFDLRE